MTFVALTDKQKKQVAKHKEKYGNRSANVFKAHLMRGKSKKEAEKIAVERTPNLPPRRPRRKRTINVKEIEVKPEAEAGAEAGAEVEEESE